MSLHKTNLPIIAGIVTSVVEIYLFLFSNFFHLFFPYTTLFFFLISSFCISSFIKPKKRVNIAISLFAVIFLIYIFFTFLAPPSIKKFASSLYRYELYLLLIYFSFFALLVWKILIPFPTSIGSKNHIMFKNINTIQSLLISGFIVIFSGFYLYLRITNGTFLDENQCFFFACLGLLVVTLFKYTVIRQLLLWKELQVGSKIL